VAVRVHPVDHPAFEQDMATIAGGPAIGSRHIMIPKVESVDDVARAVPRWMLAASPAHLPLHVLIESPAAVHRAFDIAAHPVCSPELWPDGFCVGPWRRHSRTA
jgi:citrate lyase subunit beta/citryl-CoA lyase